MASRRSPISGVLLLVGAYSSSSWAVDCLIQRGYAGMEDIVPYFGLIMAV